MSVTEVPEDLDKFSETAENRCIRSKPKDRHLLTSISKWLGRLRMGVRLYSIDKQLRTVERGAVSLEQARDVIDTHFSELKPSYTTGEEALAQTTFGFCKPTGSFVELCIHTLSEISLKFESQVLGRPVLFGLGSRRYQFEATLRSRTDVIAAVEHFFVSSDEEYRGFIEREHSR